MNTETKLAIAEQLLERATMARAISQLNGMDGLNGLDGRFTKKLKNSLKKRATLDPRKHLKLVKKDVKTAGKAVKLAAPLIVAGVATYFTGGAAAPLMKAAMAQMTSVAIKKTAKNVSKDQQKRYQAKYNTAIAEQMKKVAAQNPEAADQLKNQPIEIAAQSPIVQQASQNVIAEMARTEGVNFESPEAREYVSAVTENAAERVVNEAAKPKTGSTAALAIGLPLAFMLLG